jgi:hypothetical protein
MAIGLNVVLYILILNILATVVDYIHAVLYRFINIIEMMKSGRMRWARHIARIGQR